MGKKRWSAPQKLVEMLRQSESGTSATEIVWELGVSEQTFYCWKRKLAGLGVAEVRRVKQVE
jgi:putative transposase